MSRREFEILSKGMETDSVDSKQISVLLKQEFAHLYQPEDFPKLIIECRDSGVGISMADQKILFKMFGKLNNTSQMNTNGVGLGLFICKQIVEQFGGIILVKSELGKGTSFFFSFKIEGAEVLNQENWVPTSRLSEIKDESRIQYPNYQG